MALNFLVSLIRIIIVCCVLILMSVGVMIVWNAVIPAIFNLPAINLWQALGLFYLSNVFFNQGSINIFRDSDDE